MYSTRRPRAHRARTRSSSAGGAGERGRVPTRRVLGYAPGRHPRIIPAPDAHSRPVAYPDTRSSVRGDGTMLGFWRREPGDVSPTRPRCARCGSAVAAHYVGPGHYYCESCFARLRYAPEVPFDVVADEWTSELGALQSAGELIAVRLPGGFYGVCVLTGESAFELAQRSIRRGRSHVRTPPLNQDRAAKAPPGVSVNRNR